MGDGTLRPYNSGRLRWTRLTWDPYLCFWYCGAGVPWRALPALSPLCKGPGPTRFQSGASTQAEARGCLCSLVRRTAPWMLRSAWQPAASMLDQHAFRLFGSSGPSDEGSRGCPCEDPRAGVPWWALPAQSPPEKTQLRSFSEWGLPSDRSQRASLFLCATSNSLDAMASLTAGHAHVGRAHVPITRIQWPP